MRHNFLPGIFALALLIAGCMHITMDVNANVNVNVKLDKALNDAFDEIDKTDSTMTAAAKTPETPVAASAPGAAPGRSVTALSPEEAERRARMKQRQPQIDKFKESGALGENNLGFLEVRDNQPGAAAIADASNADRRTIYKNIAAKQNVSAEEVGKARAQQIAEKSAPGVWLQDAQGNWAKKQDSRNP